MSGGARGAVAHTLGNARAVHRRRRPGLTSRLVVPLLAALIPPPASSQTPHPLLDRMAALEVEGVTLEEALGRLRQAAGIGLVFSPDLLPPGAGVSCPCREKTVAEALEILLRGSGLRFTATPTQVRIIPAPVDTGSDSLGSVVGEVTSAEDGAPIASAMVELGEGRGALTNENGRFVVLNVPPGRYVLRVGGLGWEPEERRDLLVAAGEATAVEVRLRRRVIPLSALVISPGTFGILDEVRDLALQTLTREEIETVPQLGEDVFRSLRRLPGVASDDISTRLYLRGGTDREVLMLLDGMELFEPYHLKDFEGALGIVDLNAIGGIDLHAGGFPVDFGNHLTGVFDMQTRNPPPERTRTTLGLSITNASLLSQGDFAGGRGQWLLSARRGYMDVAFRLTDVNEDINPRYYDALAKVQYQLGARHLLSLHLLQAGDRLYLDPDAISGGDDSVVGRLRTSWGNSYAWATWRAYFTPRVRARTLVSTGRVTRSRIGFFEELGRERGPEAVDASDQAGFHFLGVKQEWTVDLRDRVAFRAGASLRGVRADYDYTGWTRSLESLPTGEVVRVHDSTAVRMEPDGLEVGAFGTVRVRPAGWLTVEGGIRFDRFSHTGDSDLSPRASALLQIGESTSLRASLGSYHQSHGIHELEAADQETEFEPSERATQVAVGIEHSFRGGLSARVEAYHRSIDRPRRLYLNLWREILPFPELDGDRRRVEPGKGRAKGLELMARWQGGRWDAAAGYALSASELLVDGRWAPQAWDQTHALSVTAGFRPDEKWNVTGAWQLRSGWPFTPRRYVVDTVTVFQGAGDEWPLWWREEFGSLNGTRLPTYHRLDLRVSRSFRLSRGILDVYLDLFNAYNQENLRSVGYGVQMVGDELRYVRYPDETLLPFLPSFGLRWEF